MTCEDRRTRSWGRSLPLACAALSPGLAARHRWWRDARPEIAQRAAAAGPGRNGERSRIPPAGRKVLDVAFYPSHMQLYGGENMGLGRRRRRRVDRTDDWEQLELLCAWDEQRAYEKIRTLVLFGGSRCWA
jgi:hypothetical protein